MSTSRKAMLLMALMLVAATAATAATAFASETHASPLIAPRVAKAIRNAADAARRVTVRTQRTMPRAVVVIRMAIRK